MATTKVKSPSKNKKPAARVKTKPAPVPAVKKSRLRTLRPRRPQPRPKRSERPAVKWTGSFRLFRDTAQLMLEHRKLFGGITLIYLLLNVILAGGLGGKIDIPNLKHEINGATGQGATSLQTSLSIFGTLLESTGGKTSGNTTAYQTIVIIVVSLAIIWALRRIFASEKTNAREAFYKGLYPLAPFVLVLVVMGIHLIPFIIANSLYVVVFGNGLAVGAVEKIIWASVIFVLSLVSLYLICSSLFALYIVTLPDMRPMQALRSARALVRYRRWTIMRKLLFLPLALLVIGILIVLPLITFVPAIAGWVFVLLSLLALPVGHTYIYHLYRELL